MGCVTGHTQGKMAQIAPRCPCVGEPVAAVGANSDRWRKVQNLIRDLQGREPQSTMLNTPITERLPRIGQLHHTDHNSNGSDRIASRARAALAGGLDSLRLGRARARPGNSNSNSNSNSRSGHYAWGRAREALQCLAPRHCAVGGTGAYREVSQAPHRLQQPWVRAGVQRDVQGRGVS